MAKAVRIVAVRVPNCAGSGTNAGVDRVTANACNSAPSRVTEAIVVGASTRTNARASFSNLGTGLDLFAPGQDITSSWNTSNTATNTISGTSMASPNAAGAAALYLAANPTASPAAVQGALVANATPNVITNPGTRLAEPAAVHRYREHAAADRHHVHQRHRRRRPGRRRGGDLGDHGRRDGRQRPGRAAGRGEHPAHLPRDLVVDLVAPDGSTYRLKNSSSTDSADNVTGTLTVNASSEVANGIWRLRVQEVFRADTGFVNSWRLTF